MGAESDIAGLGASLYGQKHIISRWFVWVSIHYELKMDKQDLQAGES